MCADSFVGRLLGALARTDAKPAPVAGRLLGALARTDAIPAPVAGRLRRAVPEAFEAPDLTSRDSLAADGDAQIIALPNFDRAGSWAAEGDEPRSSPSPGLDWTSDDSSIRVVVTSTGSDEVQILVETSRPVHEGDLLQIHVVTNGSGRDYFFLLAEDPSGLRVSALTIQGAGPSVRIELRGDDLRSAASLTAGEIEVVERSVADKFTAGRNAWRAVARARPTEDPIRQAILAALRRGR